MKPKPYEIRFEDLHLKEIQSNSNTQIRLYQLQYSTFNFDEQSSRIIQREKMNKKCLDIDMVRYLIQLKGFFEQIEINF